MKGFHVAVFVKQIQGGVFPAQRQRALLRAAYDLRLACDGPCPRREPRPRRAALSKLSKGKTPVLTVEEARMLLESIKIVKKTAEDDEAEN